MSKDKDTESEDKIGNDTSTAHLLTPLCSLRGGSGGVCPPHGDLLHPPDPGHAPLLSGVRGEGGAGVREGRHVPPGSPPVRGRQGTRGLLHYPLRGHRGDRGHEGAGVQCSSPRGEKCPQCLSLKFSPQILTKDSVTVYVSAIMWYKVKDATSAIANVDDYSGSAKLLAATTLRNVLGTRNLGDILSERESIAQEMESVLDEATDPWGVQVERVEVKDVRVPENLQRAMAAEAEAARNARAKVIAAEGEHKSSRALRHAAEVIMDSPAALQVTRGRGGK